MNLYSFLSDHFNTGTVFEMLNGKKWTYSDLEHESAKVANCVTNLGLPKGTVIATQLPKSVDNIFIYLGVIRAGMIYFPLDPAFTKTEVEFFLNDSSAVILCDTWQDMSTMFTTVDVSDTHPAVILYTSGTSGASKGAILSHGSMRDNAIAFDQVLDWQPQDRMLHCLPVFHAHGLLIATHAMLYRGSSCIWLDKFSVTDCIQALPKVTIMMAVPTIYHRLLNAITPEIAKHMKTFISASAPLTAVTAEQFYLRSGKEIVEQYGTTESLRITSNPIGNVKRGTVGKPIPGMNVRINDKDEIEINSASLFLGYHKLPSPFCEDGWFNTGDQGVFDEDGFLTIFGRTKDIIIHKGLKVVPSEVESVLEHCAGVKEVAVIGLPDVDAGESVCAVIIADDDFDIANIKDSIVALAQFKQPTTVMVFDTLPRTQLGKIQKNKIRAAIADNTAQGTVYRL
jgi:malonyl-CoA/methylmalonyl-CoA synthetase